MCRLEIWLWWTGARQRGLRGGSGTGGSGVCVEACRACARERVGLWKQIYCMSVCVLARSRVQSVHCRVCTQKNEQRQDPQTSISHLMAELDRARTPRIQRIQSHAKPCAIARVRPCASAPGSMAGGKVRQCTALALGTALGTANFCLASLEMRQKVAQQVEYEPSAPSDRPCDLASLVTASTSAYSRFAADNRGYE